MGGHLDLVKGTVVVAGGMVLALVYGAFDVLVISTALIIVHI